MNHSKKLFFSSILALLAVACSSGSSGNSRYTLGGSVSGLDNGQLVTLINNNDPRSMKVLKLNGKFTMPQKVPFNGSYNVTIATQPKNQICSVTNYAGLSVDQNIDN